MDNAGTWDTLAPLLPQGISLVAIDFPGHGLSSRYALGGFGHMIGLVITVERVVQHFGWKEVSDILSLICANTLHAVRII